MVAIREAVRAGAAHLRETSSTGRLDAELLLGHVLSRPRSFLYAHPESVLDEETAGAFRALIARRAQGVPMAYLFGRAEFWSLELLVNEHTLVPRPETERLVELALERLDRGQPCRVLDLGTGTGAIALAIASERPEAEVVATECSEATLAIARTNRDRLGIHSCRCVTGDWLAPVTGQRFDLIASNPPYVRATDPHLDDSGVRFEPRSALVAGHDGMAALRTLVAQAPHHLRPGGWLLLEHGYDQGPAVASMALAEGFVDVDQHRDMAGWPRCISARWPGACLSGPAG